MRPSQRVVARRTAGWRSRGRSRRAARRPPPRPRAAGPAARRSRARPRRASGDTSDALTLEIGALVEQRQRDRARAGSDVMHRERPPAGRAPASTSSSRLRPRHHHPRIDHQLDVAEALAPEDVGHRLALVARCARVSAITRAAGGGISHVRVEEEPLARDPQRVGDQELERRARGEAQPDASSASVAASMRAPGRSTAAPSRRPRASGASPRTRARR